jgi:phosphatidylglycerol:prolipoprotein diacylglycerol transferase
MAFHGGLLGVIAAMGLYAHLRQRSFREVADLVAPCVPIGLAAGRLGNFINGELWGRPTDGSWGMIFPAAGPLPRHPSQLYEASLEGAALFILLNLLFWGTAARLRPGLLGGVFVLGYGLIRFVLEWFREPDAGLGTLSWGLTMGQTLSLPMMVLGIWLLARALRRAPVAA